MRVRALQPILGPAPPDGLAMRLADILPSRSAHCFVCYSHMSLARCATTLAAVVVRQPIRYTRAEGPLSATIVAAFVLAASDRFASGSPYSAPHLPSSEANADCCQGL